MIKLHGNFVFASGWNTDPLQITEDKSVVKWERGREKAKWNTVVFHILTCI